MAVTVMKPAPNVATGEKAKKMAVIKNMPYNQMVYAHRLLDDGADITLIYLWVNLTNKNYKPIEHVIDVRKEVDRYINWFPKFAADIEKWYETYKNDNEANLLKRAG